MVSRLLNLAVLATVAIAKIAACRSAQAVTFDEQEVDQNQFIAVATPVGDNQYDLLVIEQIPGQQQCWSESGTKPVLVEPLLLNFDFSESCRRSTDSNGYSLRLDGKDYGLEYLLRVTERDGELYLVGTPLTNRRQPEIVVGRTYGISDGLTKIYLNSGWKFTRRVYQGQALGHVYFTSDRATIADASMTKPDRSASDSRELEFTASSQRPVAAQPPPSPANGEGIPITVPPPEAQLPSATAPSSRPLSGSPLPPPPDPQPLSTASDADSPLEPPEVERVVVPVPASAPSPAPANSVSSPSRRSLSDILRVAPRADDGSGELRVSKLPVPHPPPNSSQSNPASSGTFKVLVSASSSQAPKVRSLYPDAFSTTHNGQAMIQVGVFSSRDRVNVVLQSLDELGLTGLVLAQ
ncbi:MAG: DUF3747 domain-containing protein [Cyanophyceae cyanobacterium]